MGNLISCDTSGAVSRHGALSGHRVTSLGEVAHVIADHFGSDRLYLAMTEREV